MNIMYDRRVVRGNTYAAQIVPAVPADESASMPKPVKRRTKHIRGPAATDPVEGRRHMDVQTDSYLEELTDVVPESDIAVQTDPFIDRLSCSCFPTLAQRRLPSRRRRRRRLPRKNHRPHQNKPCCNVVLQHRSVVKHLVYTRVFARAIQGGEWVVEKKLRGRRYIFSRRARRRRRRRRR